MQEDENAEMMKLLQSADNATSDKRLNSDLRAKIYEQTRLIAELRHDEVNRQQTSRARRRRPLSLPLLPPAAAAQSYRSGYGCNPLEHKPLEITPGHKPIFSSQCEAPHQPTDCEWFIYHALETVLLLQSNSKSCSILLHFVCNFPFLML